MRTMAAYQVFFGGDRKEINAGPLQILLERRFTALGRLIKAAAEFGVACIDKELFAGFGIFDHNQPGIRQFDLSRIPQADGDQFMAPIEQGQRPFPARLAEKIGNQKDKRSSFERV